jgi:hypothetical protein
MTEVIEDGRPIYISAVDDEDAQSAPRLTISCYRCGAEETMNDEDGKCLLADLAAWASAHKCRRPISFVSVADLVAPVGEMTLARPERRSSLRGAPLRTRPSPPETP